MLKKRDLPRISEFDHIKINKQRLKNECEKFAENFISVEEANPGLCENHSKMSIIHNYFEEIPLTTTSKHFEPTDSIKERIKRKEELYWNVPINGFEGSYFQSIINQFNANATRIRITKLPPKKDLVFHIDYDPSYAVRVVIPIFTNDKVKNLFKYNNQIEEYFLKEGTAYFLNTGIEHAVINESDTNRIALIFSLDGQQDLANLK